MKKTSIILTLVMFLLMTTLAWGISNFTGKWHSSRTVLIYDTIHTMNANSLEMFIYNNGNFAYDNANLFGKTDGLYFPRGTKKTVIYDAGIWMGAKVNDQVRIAMAEYSSEFVPGPMKNGTYQADQAAFKIYKIKRGDNANNNPDYRDWPVDQGAPVDQDGKPSLLGDQEAWSACNDADVAKHTNNAGGTNPLGVEVQQTTFAYARGGALGNTIFMKFKIINKGGNRLDSAYVSLWSDPDLGNAGDDLVGCDTALSLGYCYNGAGTDNIYGSAPPSVGFDFFQGPIVPGETEDSAYSFGVWHKGFKKLGMTAFSKYINGEDPQAANETYFFMKGYRKDSGVMVPAVDPVTQETTTFVYAGDPQTRVGWLDDSPNDRRFMMTSGPFTMEPNDSQEVVAAVMVGQGKNSLNSIGALKQVDRQAQAVFDLGFNIPNPPPSPSVYARGLDGAIDLAWGTEPVGNIEISKALNQEFHFEGYNVYQGETAQGPWTKVATFDESDQAICNIDSSVVPFDTSKCDLSLIYDDIVDPAAGDAQRVIVQKGSNSGLEFHLSIPNSLIDGSRIKNNQPYFFGVTAYSVNYRNLQPFSDKDGRFLGFLSENLESPIITYEVRPFSAVGQVTQEAEHLSGASDGSVVIEYVDQTKITGHDYEVRFNDDDTWKLIDKTADSTVIDSVQNQVPGYEFPVVDGMMVRVMGPSLGVKSVAEVHTGTSVVDPPDNVNYSGNSTHEWYMDPLDTHGLERYNYAHPGVDDYEIRFLPDTTEYCWDFFGQGDYSFVNPFKVAVELWNIGSSTVDDPSDDRRVSFMILDDGDGKFGWGDGLYFDEIPYADINWIQPDVNTGTYDPDGLLLTYRRCFFYPLTDGGPWPAAGTVVRITTNKPNTPVDVFTFKTKKASDGDGELVKMSLNDVKTVPNPYYNYYNEEVDQFGRIVKFINLPPVHLKIRIFNIAGDLIRTMDRTDIYNPEFVWDLKTDRGLWVASGVYVWLIEADGLGSKFGKTAVFTEVEQLNQF